MIALIDLDKLNIDTNSTVDMCSDSYASNSLSINLAACVRDYIDHYIICVVDDDGCCIDYKNLGFAKIHDSITQRKDLRKDACA